MYTIRRAEERDIPKIMELLVQVDMVHHNGRPDIFKGPVTKYTPEELAEILADDARPVFVCEGGDGTVLGHAFCALKQVVGHKLLQDNRTLYVDDICVDEAARGQGVGKALYTYVRAFAKEQKCDSVTLNVWACNPTAMSFYEAMGMKPQKTGMEELL
jgi:ribosomal protein S18 acetylase RimI-like enzyme